ncbi:hypothetical protein NHX12_008666 [Muraenolepis orangiensis]|uniref:Uncharacterized protein n=1 Tax=Muraenolepis orangiensis TaxID=630683 RepID=A0A9Q0DQC3_9TELE|nr:hypothetical protein NHX12_008666 [Muraenolepis orangiensis]
MCPGSSCGSSVAPAWLQLWLQLWLQRGSSCGSSVAPEPAGDIETSGLCFRLQLPPPDSPYPHAPLESCCSPNDQIRQDSQGGSCVLLGCRQHDPDHLLVWSYRSRPPPGVVLQIQTTSWCGLTDPDHLLVWVLQIQTIKTDS